ncbi:MAG: oligopeptide transporter, OPT family, partial [Gallicola sp.]|nr:oligopeptide transporter, OPT family [Gallicola sp.]
MKNNEGFKPFIPADQNPNELNATSIIMGAILAIVFGAANAYLGLRVGLTISASIPAAVISMGVIRFILKRNSVLENNMAQTIGSAGESLAAGAIFTLPALFIWFNEWDMGTPSILSIFIISIIGGVLGILFMIPLRNALIVQEHGVLPYPEGTACAEVLLAGESGGAKASTVFKGLGIAAVYKFIADGLKLFPSEVHYEISNNTMRGTGVGMDVLPALLGVGYITGPRISSYMFTGGILGWFVLMPLIAFFGGDAVLFPGTDPISSMDSWGIWGSYIRYIGAGAVAAGGIISLIKSLPMIFSSFRDALKAYGSGAGTANTLRTDKDLPLPFVGIGVVAMIILIWLIPQVPVSLLSAALIVLFGFFFATVSSRMVGLIGSSNNPVSGMAIATLLFSTILLKWSGQVGREGMMAAIGIGSIICIIAAIAGDTSQDLKTGYIVGATPYRQQIGELIGVFASAIVIGFVLWLLNESWGYGSPELPAPQAILMKLVVEGVMNGNLPWLLVLAGVAIAVLAEILRIPVLPFAVGLYLPF